MTFSESNPPQILRCPVGEILPTSSGRPLSALAVVFRAPSPYPSFARFPPFPLLGGVIAVKREYVYFRVVEGGLFPPAEAN
jgi:hypothetical protein